MRRDSSRRSGGDDGLTMIELGITMLLTSVVALGAVTLLTGVTRVTTSEIARIPLVGSSAQALDTVSRALRGALAPTGAVTALASADARSVGFYAELNDPGALVVDGAPVPTKVEISVIGSCLTRSLTPARLLATPLNGSPYAWDVGGRSECLARGVQSGAIFQYFDSASMAASPLVIPASGLAATALGSVRSVSISVQLLDAATGVVGLPVTGRVTLVNLVMGDP